MSNDTESSASKPEAVGPVLLDFEKSPEWELLRGLTDEQLMLMLLAATSFGAGPKEK